MNPNAKKIIVVGSSNTDMVIRTDRMPRPGETVLGGNFMMNQGGKGANQAVAAAKLGGNTMFVAKVGNDIFGTQTIELLKQVNIDTTHVGISADLPREWRSSTWMHPARTPSPWHPEPTPPSLRPTSMPPRPTSLRQLW